MNYCKTHDLHHSTTVCPECAHLSNPPTMKEFKLIVAGGRDFNNYELLSRTLFALADVEYADHSVSIVSDQSEGAAKLGAHFAMQNGIQLWDYSTKADGALIFWDGKDQATEWLMEMAKFSNKPMTVIRY